jgi:hypothetical protein
MANMDLKYQKLDCKKQKHQETSNRLFRPIKIAISYRKSECLRFTHWNIYVLLRIRMQGSRIPDRLRQRAFHFHPDADHQRTVVRDYLRPTLRQAVEVVQRCQNHGTRLDLLNHHGDAAAAWNKRLLQNEASQCFTSTSYKRNYLCSSIDW